MNKPEGMSSNYFPTTKWTQVISVMQGDNPEAAQRALAAFCEQYRPAIVKFFQRRVGAADTANELTQKFFLEKVLQPWEEGGGFVLKARPGENRRFRKFLCRTLQFFFYDQWDEGGRRAGVGADHVPFDEGLLDGEKGRLAAEAGREFDRDFAREIIQKAVTRAAGRSEYAEFLKAHFRDEILQKEAAEKLGIDEDAFTQAYYRFRKRLAGNLREEVGKIAGPDEAEIQEEISYLISLFAGRSA